eukprot:CAMPEP_0172530356 /NCGR_PEP_ID=MMETSP1067-20121228/4110_1 /TAXON_ID=265564 ORGANISM="Thalassiosira punctigera, Strain Tpunct2005C2" /NCGR_SAMPLE_ID=MMETSP1067 /ASSEMBLY_ACC=CAM_ASM_000444 /LENGTH=316 /DNA_ID=CAMNT_0013314543 /DNA_START=279 /DNA_END=1229 /DNA_ORIENTATION=-
MASYTDKDLLADISQRLHVMRKQESSQYAVPDYLAEEWQRKLRYAAADRDGDRGHARPTVTVSVDVDSGSQMNKLWREKVCEWCYQIVDTYDFNREVVSVTMAYLDRYLATRVVDGRIFQLAAMTALYLAIKLFEPGKLRVSSLIQLSRGFFTAEHIVTMEQTMLEALKWHVHPPTPVAFCRDLVHLVSGEVDADTRHDVNELARFLTELSACDYWFVTKRPSSIALACVINAMDLQGPDRVDPKHKVEFLRWAVDIGMDMANDEVIECYGRLRQMYIAAGFTSHLDEGPAGESACLGTHSQEFVDEVAIHSMIAL